MKSRASSLDEVVVKVPVAPVARVKVPAPVSIPAVQVKVAVTVRSPLPSIAPPANVRVGMVWWWSMVRVPLFWVMVGTLIVFVAVRVRLDALTRVAALPFTAPVMVSDDALFDRVVPADRSRVSMVLVPLPA